MGRRSPATSACVAGTGRRSKPRRGFTLAECMIASIVLAIGVLGVSGAITVSSSQADNTDVDARTLSLARELVEAVAALPFEDSASSSSGGGGGAGGESGESESEAADGATSERTQISDFNGYTDVVTPNPGQSVADTISYSRSVSVEFRTAPNSAPASGDFAVVTVTVTPSTRGGPVVLSRLVTKYNQVRN